MDNIVDAAKLLLDDDSIRPICAVCQKPVDRATIDRNIESFMYEFKFFCHGAVEKVELSPDELERCQMELIECFRDARDKLSSGQPLLPSGDK